MTCPDCGSSFTSPTCKCGFDPRAGARPALTEDELLGRDATPVKRHELQETNEWIEVLKVRVTQLEGQISSWRTTAAILIALWILQKIVTQLR